MNLSQFRSSVSNEVGLDNTNSSTEQGLIDTYVNQGVVQLLRKTRCFVKDDSMTLTANEKDYDISQGVLEFLAIDLTPASGGIYPRPQRVGLDEILDRRKLAPLTGPCPRLYAFSGSNLISFYPTPTGADTATIYYVPRPSALAATADDPSTTAFGGIPSEYHDAIEYYAFYRAASYDDSPNSQRYYQLWNARYREIRREVQRTGGTKIPHMKVRTRYGLGHRNLGYQPGVDWYGSYVSGY